MEAQMQYMESQASFPAGEASARQWPRRRMLAALAAIAAMNPWRGTQAQAATGAPIRFGQSAGLTGPLAELGQALLAGAKVGFDAINAQGGVNGRPIELVSRDDGYDSGRALANVRDLLAQDGVFGLFGCMGTPMIEAILPLLRGTEIPCFAPLTGALSARPRDMRNMLPIRASYPDEVERLIQHLATVGLQRIGLVTQDNAFGAEVSLATEGAVARHRLALAGRVTVRNDAGDAVDAAQRLAAAAPDVVLIGLAGKPTVGFVKAFRLMRRGTPLYALSVLGSAATLAALGEDGVGIAVAQLVPLPGSALHRVSREFMQAWRAAGVALAPSHLAMEGYINARVLAEVLRRCPTPLTRAGFLQTAWNVHGLDLGDFRVGFEAPGHGASRFVDLTLTTRDGKFIH
jgi:ABC-type branched-subunit amino acid transport system substrate-binding protein